MAISWTPYPAKISEEFSYPDFDFCWVTEWVTCELSFFDVFWDAFKTKSPQTIEFASFWYFL